MSGHGDLWGFLPGLLVVDCVVAAAWFLQRVPRSCVEKLFQEAMWQDMSFWSSLCLVLQGALMLFCKVPSCFLSASLLLGVMQAKA